MELLTTAQAARVLQVTPENVRRLARLGKLRTSLRVADIRLFDRADVEKLLHDRLQRNDEQSEE